MAVKWSEADLPLFREQRINDPKRALRALAAEARSCTRCDLYKNATQTVFGEGPADAALMLIGEQPGDQEDLRGARSSAPPARYSTAHWKRPKSTAPRSTSPTR
jgi:hypothetical protein